MHTSAHPVPFQPPLRPPQQPRMLPLQQPQAQTTEAAPAVASALATKTCSHPFSWPRTGRPSSAAHPWASAACWSATAAPWLW